MVVSPRGTNGMTSTAPIRGCSPGVLVHRRSRRSPCPTRRSSPADDRLVLARDREHRAVVARVGGAVEQVTRRGRRSGPRRGARRPRAAGPRRRWARFRRARPDATGPSASGACARPVASGPDAVDSPPRDRQPDPQPPPPPRLPQALDRRDDLGLRVSAITQLALPLIAATVLDVGAVRVRPAHDDRVPAVHPAQPAGRRLGRPPAPPPDPDRRRPRPRARDRCRSRSPSSSTP